MIVVYILLGILGLYLVIGSLLVLILHHHLFGKRWEPDGIIRYYDYKDFAGLIAKPVEFKRKKTILRGNFYYYDSFNKEKLLVFAHGMWGSHCAYIQEIERLAKAGFTVLGFDYYGTELSDGKKTRSLAESLISLDYALRFVKNEYPDSKIYVMGHSWGGFAAINIVKYHPDIIKVAAMAPFLSVNRLFRSIFPKKLWGLIPFLLIIEFIKSRGYACATGIKSLNNADSKVLIIHSQDDFLVKYAKHTKYLQDHLTNDNVNYLIVENRLHNPDYSNEAIEYSKTIMNEMKQLNKEEKLEYRKKIDYQLLGKLDDDIIDKIIEFL